MASLIPRSFPLGESLPPNSPHAVSVSLPTWESVTAWGKREQWIINKMTTGYPRFFINTKIRQLSDAVLHRLNVTMPKEINSMVFVSEASAVRFVETLSMQNTDDPHVELIKFFLPKKSGLPLADAYWAAFNVVLYPTGLAKEAAAYWRDTGDGISTRHAEFCLDRLDYLQSESTNPTFCTPPIRFTIAETRLATPCSSGVAERRVLQEFIADLTSSEQPGQRKVNPESVFLYPRGMSAIYSVMRALASIGRPSRVVAYGWLYSETIKVIQRSNGASFTFYGGGTEEELDKLETELAAGKRIQALFCELPGNPKLLTPDLHRIRKLADKYNFIVLCDETVGTFVNVDILPYVDIVMSSLTKMFSGYADVMGGSIVLNQQSRYHDLIHSTLAAEYEDTCFPLDLVALRQNSLDFVQRSHRSNHSGKLVAELLAAHPSVVRLNYPSMGSTAQLYERYRRRNGGYGHLMSIIFRNQEAASCFYDSLDACKGTSFGTNFTLAIPYVQLAHYHEQDWVESYGVPRHIVRLSVGLEDPGEILKTVARALAEVEKIDQPVANVVDIKQPVQVAVESVLS
ncbi:hypothetical protein B7463_g7019, partial [Scytalidium lignicola]